MSNAEVVSTPPTEEAVAVDAVAVEVSSEPSAVAVAEVQTSLSTLFPRCGKFVLAAPRHLMLHTPTILIDFTTKKFLDALLNDISSLLPILLS